MYIASWKDSKTGFYQIFLCSDDDLDIYRCPYTKSTCTYIAARDDMKKGCLACDEYKIQENNS